MGQCFTLGPECICVPIFMVDKHDVQSKGNPHSLLICCACRQIYYWVWQGRGYVVIN